MIIFKAEIKSIINWSHRARY